MPESGAHDPFTDPAQTLTFLLQISDALGSLSDPISIQDTVTRAALQAFGADRCYYCEREGDAAIIRRDAARGTLPSMAGTYPLSQFPLLRAVTEAGRPFAVSDVRSDERIDDAFKQLCLGRQVVSFLNVPVIKEGQVVGVLCLVQGEPRTWSEGEMQLAQDIAERTWGSVERARVEETLRQSEAKYRTLFDAMDEGFCTIQVLFDGSGTAVDYRFLEMNAAFVRQTGLEHAVGRTMRELAPDHEVFWYEVYGQVALTGESRRFEHSAAALGRYYDVFALRTGAAHEHRVAVLFNDISERKRSDLAIVRLNQTLEQRVEERTQELTDERTALDAFVAFTEMVGTETNELELVSRAITVLHAALAYISVAYYQLDGDLWKATSWSADVPAEVVDQLRAGIPQDAPHLAEAIRSGGPVFVNHWDAAEDQMDQAAMYGAAAFIPLFVESEPPRIFALGTQAGRAWTVREQAVVRAVGRSLTLALERADQARKLAQQKDELDARTRALEGFAALTRDLRNETGRYALIRRAQEIMLSLLSPGYALYWERTDDHWQLRSQVGDIGNPELQRLVDDHGLPLDAPALHSTWLTGVPNYQDNYMQGADTPAEMIRHVNAATAFQVCVYGQPIGMLAIGLFDQRRWTTADKAVLETAIDSLEVVLERAQALESLAQSNAALKASNEELEAFNYSVSHDLLTPVRHVEGFASMARRNLHDTEKVSRHLDTVTQAAKRMETLIASMLTLSRTGRRELTVGEVNLEALVVQARMDVQPQVQERSVEWQIGRMPVVQGDRVTLQQVMTNLIENAVKYSRLRTPAVIEVWAEDHQREWCVFVRDNGAGFDARYGGKLFGIFQRLHHHDEFEGTGVGLSLVRRIIVRHGGTVGAEGEIGQGATFHFSLPKAAVQDVTSR